MADSGLSNALVTFLSTRISRRLRAIDEVLRGDRYAESPEGRRTCGVWAQIDENRAILELLKREAPQLLEQHPELEDSFAHRDAWLTDLADAASVSNPFWLWTARGWPRPWPGSEDAPLVFGPQAS